MGDAEKLRLYAKSVVSKHQALDDALVKVKARSKLGVGVGQEETFTSQTFAPSLTGKSLFLTHPPPWEMPTVSSLVPTMSVEDLRSFSQVPIDISLELSDGEVINCRRGR